MSNNQAKQQLIEAASRLFRLRGYHGVGLNEIIEASGTAKGSLYYYFPEGKEQLAIAAIEHTKQFISSRIQEKLNETEEPILAIQNQFREVAKEWGKEGGLGLPIGTIAGETYSVSEPLRLACKSVFGDWQHLYYDKLTASGYSDVQAKELALLLVALLEGGILLCLTAQSAQPLTSIAEKVPAILRK